MVQQTIKVPKSKTKYDKETLKLFAKLDRIHDVECVDCRKYKPRTVHSNCDICEKIIINHEPMGLQNTHLFIEGNGHCKYFDMK